MRTWEHSGWLKVITFVILPAVGMVLVMLFTAKYGIAHHSDSARFIQVGQSVARGQGFLEPGGKPYIVAAPLYPALLAVPAKLGIDALEFARIFQTILFGVTIGLVAKYALQVGVGPVLVLLAAAFTAVSQQLTLLAGVALTDSLYVFLSVAALLSLHRHFDRPQWSSLIIAAAIASLAWLTRYVGIALAGAGTLTILACTSGGWWRRFRAAAVYGAIATLPTAVWLTRNFLATGQLRGTAAQPDVGFVEMSARILASVSRWFAPSWIGSRAQIALGALVLVCIGGVTYTAVHALRKSAPSAPAASRLAAGMYALLYALLIGIVLTVSPEAENPDRYMAAILPVVIILMSTAVSLVEQWTRDRNARVASRMVWVALVGILVWNTRLEAGTVARALRVGAGGYANARWVNSEMVRMLRADLPRSVVYTNEPNALYFLTDLDTARWLPPFAFPGAERTPERALAGFNYAAGRDSTFVIVLFIPGADGLPYFEYRPSHIRSIFRVEESREFSDGFLFRVRAPSVGEAPRAGP